MQKITPAQNARNLRYKKPALELVQRSLISDELQEIGDECYDMQWLIEDNENEVLSDALDGDTDELHEFRFNFSDLQAKCEKMHYELAENDVTKYFDDFLVAALGQRYRTVGYDSYQEDYYSLTRYEHELAESVAGKRLSNLTKKEIISVAGQCMGIFWAFLDIRHSYDCLKSAFDVLKEDRAELMAIATSIENRYEQLQENIHDYELHRMLDNALSLLPGWIWVQ